MLQEAAAWRMDKRGLWLWLGLELGLGGEESGWGSHCSIPELKAVAWTRDTALEMLTRAMAWR